MNAIGKVDNVTITFNSIAFPDYSENHGNEGKVQKEIRSGKYDFVVAQQGPSALPATQLLLLEFASKQAEVCNKNNTRLAVHMIWLSKSTLFDLDALISSYSKAANETSSLLCPAGLARKHAWRKKTALPLYSPDNFHPSFIGSLPAAPVIYGVLMKKRILILFSMTGVFGKMNLKRLIMIN